MATVDPKIAALVARMPEIHVAVIAERDKLEGIARGLFASHDNPGRHEITTTDEKVDALLSLEGPAPLSVEFGHWTHDHKKHVEGLHILGRAIAAASA